jgi:hypothetical protein
MDTYFKDGHRRVIENRLLCRILVKNSVKTWTSSTKLTDNTTEIVPKHISVSVSLPNLFVYMIAKYRPTFNTETL